MKKEFNITGICFPHLHYMMDSSQKLKNVMALIEGEKYFTINRPRQFGKTTTLYFLAEALRKTEDYLPIELNFQGIDSKWHKTDEAFAKMFLSELQKNLKFEDQKLSDFVKTLMPSISDMNTLSEAITELVHHQNKKIVLFIDEVDASSNFDPFLNFLGMLRTKYLARIRPQHATFHSIVLAGVHDIKTIKHKMRSQGNIEYNSPWNIATDFEVDMRFNPKEIAPMLEQYCEAEKVTMDIPSIAERLHYHTSGYPFLVSKLCKNVAEKILLKREDNTWTLADIEAAVQLLLKENNTNFDSLIKNLEHHPDLYQLAYEIIINGLEVTFNPHEPVASLGRLYGIFKSNGRLKIHNRIYEQILYDYMTAKTFRQLLKQNRYDFGTSTFVNEDNTLNLEKVLLRFQKFMKEERSQKNKQFLEKEWRIIFLAFLKPILNGKGHDFKEVQISDEKRLDIILTFYEHKYVIELKIWRGDKAHEKGLNQLADYLDRQNESKGYLLIFDNRQIKSFQEQIIQRQGKEIFAVWV